MRCLVLLLVVLGFNSCLYFGGATYIDKKKNAVENNLIITTKQVMVTGPLKVVLTNGTDNKAVMTQDLFESLDIEIIDDVTVVKPIQKLRPYGLGFFEIRLAVKNFDTITVATDRNISTPQPLETNTLTLNLNSAVAGTLHSRIKNLTLNVNSVKPLTFIGTADTLTITTNSFARVDLRRLIATNEVVNSKTFNGKNRMKPVAEYLLPLTK